MSTLIRNSKLGSTVFILFCLFFVGNAFGQKTWTGSTNRDWDNASNWSPAGIPIATDDVIIPNVTNDPRYDITTTTVNSITINNGGFLDFQRANSYQLIVTNNVTVNTGGTFRIRAGGGGSSVSTLFVGGNFTNTGTVDFVDDTDINLVLNGTNQTISGAGNFSLQNFTCSNNGTITVNSDIQDIFGTLLVNANSTIAPAAGIAFNSTGAAGTITGTGTIKVSRTSSLLFTDQYLFTTYTLSDLTVDYSGTGNQTVFASTYGSLVLSGSGTKAFGGSTTVNGDFDIKTGVVANLGTVTTHTARALFFNGVQQVAGQ